MSNIHKEIKNFKIFLAQCGVEVLIPTSEWEVIRFKANGNVGIIYQNKIGNITSFSGEAEKAWKAFKNKQHYEVVKKVKRPQSKSVLKRTLLKRDGAECFYCGNEIENGFESIEHLFSINQGGCNHIANLALCHVECNQKASSLSIVEKVKLRENLRHKG